MLQGLLNFRKLELQDAVRVLLPLELLRGRKRPTREERRTVHVVARTHLLPSPRCHDLTGLGADYLLPCPPSQLSRPFSDVSPLLCTFRLTVNSARGPGASDRCPLTLRGPAGPRKGPFPGGLPQPRLSMRGGWLCHGHRRELSPILKFNKEHWGPKGV